MNLTDTDIYLKTLVDIRSNTNLIRTALIEWHLIIIIIPAAIYENDEQSMDSVSVLSESV